MKAPEETDDKVDLHTRLAKCNRLLAIAERDCQARADESGALRNKAEDYDRLAIALTAVREERDALLTSTSWRLTAPLRGLIERIRGFRSGAGLARRKLRSFSRHNAAGSDGSTVASDVGAPKAFPEPWPAGPPRVTLLVECFRAGALAGGVAAAAMIAVAMAHRQRSPLRIISRLAPPEPKVLDDLMDEHGLAYDENPSFDFITIMGRGPVIGMTATERIVVGSCEDARLALQFVSADRVVHVIDQAAVPVLTGTGTDPRVRNLVGVQGPSLVFMDADVRAALRPARLFGNRDAGVSAWVLPNTPSVLDWQLIAARLLEDAPSN